MELDLVKELIKEFETSNVSKMKIEIEGINLELEKDSGEVEYVVKQPTVNQTIKEVSEPTNIDSKDTFIKAPLVGVFYSSSAPDKEAFVEVGSKVKKGQTLCIIEAMKVMNEIKAPQDGIITSILASNDDLIEYDQIIMTLEPNV